MLSIKHCVHVSRGVPVIGGRVEVDRCTSMVVLHFGQLSVLILVQIFLVVTQCHSFLGLLAIGARCKNLICMLKQKILNILEFRLKTTEIAIGLAIALAIGATLGLGIHIHT